MKRMKLTAVLCACLLLTACALSGAEEPPEQEYLEYSQTQLPVEQEVGRNGYDSAAFVTGENGRISYTGEGVEALTVIDVSSHQGEINWAAVAADGVTGAILRAGYRGYGSVGNIKEDATFRANLQGATEAGLLVGVYFYSQAVSVAEAEEEADFILTLLSGRELALPVVFDWEHIDFADARTDAVTAEELTGFAVAFCERVEAAGYAAMVYFNQETAYMIYELGKLTDYAFWLAEYDPTPSFYYDFVLWQYSNAGTVQGIDVTVDLNLYFRHTS